MSLSTLCGLNGRRRGDFTVRRERSLVVLDSADATDDSGGGGGDDDDDET